MPKCLPLTAPHEALKGWDEKLLSDMHCKSWQDYPGPSSVQVRHDLMYAGSGIGRAATDFRRARPLCSQDHWRVRQASMQPHLTSVAPVLSQQKQIRQSSSGRRIRAQLQRRIPSISDRQRTSGDTEFCGKGGGLTIPMRGLLQLVQLDCNSAINLHCQYTCCGLAQ